MKLKKLFLVCGLASLFVACSNDNDSTIESVTSPSVPSLDLQALEYNDLVNVLSNISFSEQTISLHDGADSWNIHLKHDPTVNIEENGHKVNVFFGHKKDSVEAILSPDYATLRLHRNGNLISYVTYKDNEEMANVANHYKTQYLPTRNVAMDDIVAFQMTSGTRSGEANIGCVRINTTKAIENNPIKGFYGSPKCENLNNQLSSIISRGADEIQRTISFVLLKENDGNALDHEIVWQIADTKTSIEFLVDAGIIIPGYIVMDTKHKGVSPASYPALFEFQSFLRNADLASGHGEKVYVLMRDGIWDDGLLGLANDLGMIHLLNPYSNFEIAALSTSSSLHPYTLAHEIGHLLGAEHVDNEEDLMYSSQSEKQTPVHKSADNIDRIVTSLHLGI